LKEDMKMQQPDPEAVQAVAKLLGADESQLYETLGIREKAIEKSPELANRYDIDVDYDATEMGPKEFLRDLGVNILRRWNKEAYKLICGGGSADEKDRNDLVRLVASGSVDAGGVLAGILVASLGIAPAIAAVIAVIVLKRFVKPAGEEFCKLWAKNLD
jgi:hypothetical protein